MSPIESPNISSSSSIPPINPSPQLPANISFENATKNYFNNPSALVKTSVGAIGLTALGYQQENYPLFIAGLTICALALARVCALKSNRSEYESLVEQNVKSFKDELESLKKLYPIEKFNKLSGNFNNHLKRILTKELQELYPDQSEVLSKETSLLIDELSLFASDQLAPNMYDSGDDFNKIMELLLKCMETRVTDLALNLKKVKTHIKSDLAEIQQVFFPDYKGELDEFSLEFPTGETHNQGKSACFVTFANDPSLKVVYKPRSLEIDALHANRDEGLFHILNTFAGKELLPTHRLLDKQTHGYAEFLSTTENDKTFTLVEMIKYYHMIGREQAFGQIFGLRDLHSDNVLVHDRKPYIIDLEVAFNIEALRGSHSTELYSAVIYNTESTNNIVALNIDGRIVPMEEHFKKFNQVYEESIQTGFEEMKQVISQHKEELKQFIENLPDQLLVRYVPVSTSSFKTILGMNQLTEQASDVAFVLNNGLKKEHIQILEEVNPETTNLDIIHHDVPILYQALGGNYSYHDKVIAKDRDSSKPLIKSMIDHVESLKIEETFLEVIRSRRNKR